MVQGGAVFPVFMQSGLPKDRLKAIWDLVAGDRLLCKRSSGHWTWAVVESIDDSTAGARAGVTCVVEANGRTKPVSREYWTQCLRAPLDKNVLHPPS